MKLVYSEQAVADLVRLRTFLADKDPAAASRVALELVSRIERIEEFPYLGVAVPQAAQPGVIRDMVFGSYVVRYAAQPESLVVLRLWHHLEDRSEGHRTS